jgi:hypothetical protein
VGSVGALLLCEGAEGPRVRALLPTCRARERDMRALSISNNWLIGSGLGGGWAVGGPMGGGGGG